MRVQDGLFLRS